MSRHSFLTFIGAASLFLSCALSGAEKDERGVPYRMLWDSYQFGLLSSDESKRLTITSTGNVNPETFHFSPSAPDGRTPLSCDRNGVCTVIWIPEFYTHNQDIHSDQPKGSPNVSFGWSSHFNANVSLEINLLLYGRTYFESLYYSLCLLNDGLFRERG